MRSKYYDKEKCRVYVARYRARFPEKSRRWIRESYARHAEKRRQYARDQRAKIQNDPILRAKRNEKDRIRKRKREQDIGFLLHKRIRTRMLMAIKRNDKASSTVVLLGCSIQDLRKHIESKWTDGMSWETHGKYGWHIDHIVPCHKFDFSKPEDQRRCFHYTNLQPLWCLDNWRKDGRPDRAYKKL